MSTISRSDPALRTATVQDAAQRTEQGRSLLETGASASATSASALATTQDPSLRTGTVQSAATRSESALGTDIAGASAPARTDVQVKNDLDQAYQRAGVPG